MIKPFGIAAFLLLLTISHGWSEYRVPLRGELAATCLDHALLCMAIYDSEGDAYVIGWNGPIYEVGGLDFRKGPGGLNAGVYTRPSRQANGEADVVLAFRGSEATDMADWLTNLQNFWGLVPDAHLTAGRFAQAAWLMTSNDGKRRFSATGHSLGGGLASYSALLVAERGYCFGSAALGPGTQEVLWREASPATTRAPSLVTHVFKTDDVVPVLSALNGRHFGAIGDPLLSRPANYAGAHSQEEMLAYLLLAGAATGKWYKHGATAAGTWVKEGHGIDHYVAGLCALVTPSGGVDPVGEWESGSSFYDLTSSRSHFRFHRNGTMSLINDLKFLDLPGEKFNASGYWEYAHPHLKMHLPGLARMTYRAAGGDGIRVVQWHRQQMDADVRPVEGASPEAVALVGGISHLVLKSMEGKTIQWERLPVSAPIPAQPSR